MAVRTGNGKSADTLVADPSYPKTGETITLERYMGREMRARYLNPRQCGGDGSREWLARETACAYADIFNN